MKLILVPIDFSTASEHSADYAAALASELKAEIVLLHVYTELAPVMDAAGFPVAAMDAEIREDMLISVNKIRASLATRFGIVVRGKVESGFKGDTIREIADTLNVDLICIGRKSAKYQQPYGGTISRTLRKSKVPLLVIPENCDYKRPKNIVLAIDFKEVLHADTVRTAFELVKREDAVIQLLHVAPLDESLSNAEVFAKLHLPSVFSHFNFLYQTIESENVESSILEYIEDHLPDMLIMIPHHHGVLGRLFGEQHTAPVISKISIPLLLLKA